MMTRIYLFAVVGGAVPVRSSGLGVAAGRARQSDLRQHPEPAAGLSEKLDAYLNARQATPLGFSPKGQLLITTRFGDVDQLHLVERRRANVASLRFCAKPITQAAFSPDPDAAPTCISRM